jgi:hypothetical protein
MVTSYEREHGLMGTGSLTVYSTLTINSYYFNMFGTGGVTVASGGTLNISPPYATFFPSYTGFFDYGAPNTSFPSPYPTITVSSGGTLNWNAAVRASYPGDFCNFNVNLMNSGTVTASSPACRIIAPLVSIFSPPTTSTLGGTLTLTGTGRLEFLGGSVNIPSTFSGSAASSTNNYVRFGNINDQNIATYSSNAWTYISVPSAVTVNIPLWFQGTTYLAGGGKLTVSKLTYGAGIITNNVDISSAFNIIDNDWAVSSAYNYIVSNITLLSGSSSTWARTPRLQQAEGDYSSVVIRPYSGITVNSGASVQVSFLPLWTASSLPGTIGRVTNAGSISFTQSTIGAMAWDVYVSNTGTISTTGSVRGNSQTAWDYPVGFTRGGVSTGTVTFNNGLGFIVIDGWTLSGGSWSAPGSPTGLLGWYAATSASVLTFAADTSLPGIEIVLSGTLTTTGNRIIRLGSLQMSNNHAFCCSGSTYIVSGSSVFGDAVSYSNYYTLTLNGASFENYGTLVMPLSKITALTSSSFVINRGTMNVIQQGISPSNNVPTHLINYGTLQLSYLGGNFPGITSNGSITFVPNTGVDYYNAYQTLFWSAAFILNTTNTLTMNVYQADNLPSQSWDQIFPGSVIGSYGQYCYLAGTIRVQFQVANGQTWTPAIGMAYQLMDWAYACEGTFSAVTYSGLPGGLGVKILYAKPSDVTNIGVWAVVCSLSGDTACGTIGPKNPDVTPATLSPSLYPFLLGNYPPPAAPVAAPKAAPVAAPVAVPVAAPKAAPVAAPVTAPVASPKAAPVAAPVATPVAAPNSAPVSAAPKAAPVAAPVSGAAPVSSPKAAPVAGGSAPVQAPSGSSSAPTANGPAPVAGNAPTAGGSAPSSTGGNAPSGGGGSAPSSAGNAPSSGGSAPSGNGNAPSGSGGNAPTGSGGNAPTDNGGNAPSGGGGSAPSDSGNAPSDSGSAPQDSGNAPTDGTSAPSGSGGNTPTGSNTGAPKAAGGNAPSGSGNSAPTGAQINTASSSSSVATFLCVAVALVAVLML